MIHHATATSPTARLVADVQDRLRNGAHPYFRQVSCVLHDGDVFVLTGEVPSFYAKQLAQELIRGMKRNARIDNRLVVAH